MRDDLILAIFYVALNAAWQPFALAAIVRVARGRLAPRDMHFLTLFAAVAASLLPVCSALMTPPVASVVPVSGPSTATQAVTVVAMIYVVLLLVAIFKWIIALGRALRLRRSTSAAGNLFRGDVATPLTILSSIVVPQDFETWPRTIRESCIAHERAHVAHRDWWWSIAIQFLALPLSFHPVWIWLHRELEFAREEARDAEAAGNRQLEYADALLFVADRHVRAVALTLGFGSSLERRLERLLRPVLTPRPAAGLVATVAVVLTLFAARIAAPHFTAAAIAGHWVNASGDLPVALELYTRGDEVHGIVRFDAVRKNADRRPVRIRTDLISVVGAVVKQRRVQLSAPTTLLALEPISENEAILHNRYTGATVLMKRTPR